MKSVFIFLGSFSAFLGVGMGAFGAHGLKPVLSAESLSIYQTGVSYQMWHALGIIGIALLQQQAPESKLVPWAGWLMFLGILLFSGSLYLLALSGLRWFGMVTPIGGVCFLIAWLLVCCSAIKKKSSRRYK
jgi:uncharacterized membrane protein YgdD (TMEM256/DUF423 family)